LPTEAYSTTVENYTGKSPSDQVPSTWYDLMHMPKLDINKLQGL